MEEALTPNLDLSLGNKATIHGWEDEPSGRVLRGEGVRHVERNQRGLISLAQEALLLGFSIQLKQLALNRCSVYGVFEVKRVGCVKGSKTFMPTY
jgi:hypothetical protein